MALVSTSGLGVFTKGQPVSFLRGKVSTLSLGVFTKGQPVSFLTKPAAAPVSGGRLSYLLILGIS